MAPTSTTHWPKTAGASGIGSMRRGIRFLKVGEGRTRSKERFMGRSAAGAAVGVAEIQVVVWGSSMTEDNPINPMNQADPRNQTSPMNRGAADVPFQPVR